jgi:hypothetical protein
MQVDLSYLQVRLNERDGKEYLSTTQTLSPKPQLAVAMPFFLFQWKPNKRTTVRERKSERK